MQYTFGGIIFGFNEGEISLLLLKRNFEPAMGEWSLMGGFVQNNESVDDAVDADIKGGIRAIISLPPVLSKREGV